MYGQHGDFHPLVQDTWRDKSACGPAIDAASEDDRSELAKAWLNEDSPLKDRANQICKEVCKVREQCVRDAIQDPQSIGRRGGFYFQSAAVTSADNKLMMKELGFRAKTRQKVRKTGTVQQETE